MKATCVIAAAAFACACGSGTPRSDTTAAAAPANTASPNSRAAGNTAENPTNQAVMLEGCLRGPSAADATGTSGTRDRARSTVPTDVAGSTPSGGSFTLVNAKPASPDSAGTGANGAGGSGGPLVSGQSTFDLDAMPADARGNVNKQVRITGRLVANEMAGEPRTTGGTAVGTAGSGSQANAGTSGRRLIVDSVQVVADKCAAQ